MRRRSWETPTLGVKFDRDLQQPGFILAQVWIYMQDNGPKIATEAGKVRCVTTALEGAVVWWMVTLHNDDAPELRNFNRFMVALCKRFKDPLADCKAREHIKTINQGHRGVAEYTQEFCDLCAGSPIGHRTS